MADYLQGVWRVKNKIAELNKLIEENPDMPVKMFVGVDELCDDSFYTEHHIISIEISEWFQIEEHIYIDEDELSEYYEDNLECTEEVAREMAVQNLIDVILITTGA